VIMGGVGRVLVVCRMGFGMSDIRGSYIGEL